MSSKVTQVANAAAPVVKRDVNKWLYRLRQFLMLRDFTPNQRYESEMAKRTQPDPHLPEGFAHKLNKNYYYDRDARRQVGQPQVIFSNAINNQLLASSTAQSQLTAGSTPAQATAQPVAAAAAAPTTTNTSLFLSIPEAEKQTAASLTAMHNQEQKTHGQARTPGKIYNWDG